MKAINLADVEESVHFLGINWKLPFFSQLFEMHNGSLEKATKKKKVRMHTAERNYVYLPFMRQV